MILAFAVIDWQCFALTAGSPDPAKATAAWPIAYALVPMFFALSGFLVTGSALRLTLGKFAASRVSLIGPALTSLDLATYATTSDTFRCPLNIVGEIHYYLPGVFDGNPNHAVNGSLWTIRPELRCHAAIGLLIAGGWVRDWRVAATLMAAFSMLIWAIRCRCSRSAKR